MGYELSEESKQKNKKKARVGAKMALPAIIAGVIVLAACGLFIYFLLQGV